MFTKNVGVNYINLGNTCFIDSAVNVYASDPNVVHFECQCKNCKRNQFCVLRCLHDTLKQQQSSQHEIKPIKLFQNTKKINNSWDPKKFGGQFCAGEYLQSLLNEVRDTINEQIVVDQSFPVPHPSFVVTETITTICKVCGLEQVETNQQCQIVLPIHNRTDIIDCLNDIQKVSTLDDDNKKYCNGKKCKRDTKHTRQHKYAVGKTLYLILSGGTAINGSWFTKINRFIKYYKVLNCFEFPLSLCGVLEHVGNTGEYGHFISYRKILNRNAWYKYDNLDTKPQRMPETFVLKRPATILVYASMETVRAHSVPPRVSGMDMCYDEHHLSVLGLYASQQHNVKYIDGNIYDGTIEKKHKVIGWTLQAGDIIRYPKVSSLDGSFGLRAMTIIYIGTAKEVMSNIYPIVVDNSVFRPEMDTEVELVSPSINPNPITTADEPILFKLKQCMLIPSSIKDKIELKQNRERNEFIQKMQNSKWGGFLNKNIKCCTDV